MAVLFNNTFLCENNGEDPTPKIERKLGLLSNDFYLISNGKLLDITDNLPQGNIHVIPRLRGGKGGFGSMLRAIGAQIEKTTNREACRDLSGRRLRDINEEQRLKKWIDTQAERVKEAAKRKQKKLEKLCEEPKFEFKDEHYDKERSLLPEIVEDAVLQGISKASSSKTQTQTEIKKRKPKLWIDEEFSDSDSSDDEENENKGSDEKTRDNGIKKKSGVGDNEVETQQEESQEKGIKRKNASEETEVQDKRPKFEQREDVTSEENPKVDNRG